MPRSLLIARRELGQAREGHVRGSLPALAGLRGRPRGHPDRVPAHPKPVRARLGRVRVQDLARSDIERVIRALREERGLSHRSVVYTLGAIRQVLAYGIAENVLATNVASSVRAPRKQHGDSKPKIIWTPEELVRFRAVADQDEWAAAWRLTLYGLRRSEVLGMRWEAVNLEHRDVAVQAGRVLLDRTRTATDDPKSSASHRTLAVEEVQPGTVAQLRSRRGRPLTGWSWVPGTPRPVRPGGSARSARQALHVLRSLRGSVP